MPLYFKLKLFSVQQQISPQINLISVSGHWQLCLSDTALLWPCAFPYSAPIVLCV